jgi:MurNAc alpha-1-phosphate uridylyltransferase
MKAMIFAAGVGSRLKDLTRDTPKCLMQIGGVTMLERVVSRLKDAGVSSVAINVHHHAEKVIQLVESRLHFGIEVTFSHEQALLDTGGGLKKLRSFFEGEDAFFIHNADIYCTTDLTRLMRAHRERQAVATLLVMERSDPRGLYFEHDHRLVGWTGEQHAVAPSARLLPFCGISVASGMLFKSMGSEEAFSIVPTFLRAARTTSRVFAQPLEASAEWVDIGTPEELSALQRKHAASASQR